MIFGGRSGEHEVSLASAASVLSAIDPARYDVIPMGITRDGHWLVGGSPLRVLAEAAVYLACAPKSNAVYTAFDQARADVHARPAEPVPLHLRNAPTRLMTGLGYGAGYRYAHDDPDAVVLQEHLPAALRGRTYYHPVPRGFEQEIRARLERWRAELRRRKAEEAP